jgi:methionyl aminopeptidase
MYRGMIIRKTSEQIEAMAAAGDIQARCLGMLRSKARPGVTTKQLDEAAEKFIRSQGAVPSFKGYRGFPGSICTSPNSMVVHGIPGSYELRRGDILSIDVGVTYEGWVADAAITLAIGETPPDAEPLLTTTREALFEGIAQAVPGNHLSDISHAVQTRVERDGLSIIRSLVGHGIGREMHEDPQIPNFGEPGHGPLLQPGMTLAIEPMINAGGPDVYLHDDEWSISTADRSLSAHFEHTVAVTKNGPLVLTMRPVSVNR